ncbi:MAG: hypothetical protein KME64_18240 [Scytonematopsis contorta HA4267-MV1]|nr:hypothetical protein [Scytonematopsis contorta HA4267-MV1]
MSVGYRVFQVPTPHSAIRNSQFAICRGGTLRERNSQFPLPHSPTPHSPTPPLPKFSSFTICGS